MQIRSEIKVCSLRPCTLITQRPQLQPCNVPRSDTVHVFLLLTGRKRATAFQQDPYFKRKTKTFPNSPVPLVLQTVYPLLTRSHQGISKTVPQFPWNSLTHQTLSLQRQCKRPWPFHLPDSVMFNSLIPFVPLLLTQIFPPLECEKLEVSGTAHAWVELPEVCIRIYYSFFS